MKFAKLSIVNAISFALLAACSSTNFMTPNAATTSSKDKSADSTGTASGTGSGNSSNANSSSSSSGGTGSGITATASAGGDDQDDSGNGTSTGTSSGTSSGTGSGTNTGSPSQNSGSKDDLTPAESAMVQQMPGTPVVRVGVNFEDTGATGDKDFNDAVLCFQGNFKVDSSNVTSISNQQVIGTTSSISGCHHTLTARVVHADGTQEAPIVYDSRSVVPITMNFKVGSKLEVTMVAAEAICAAGVVKSMHNPVDCRVLPDVCNTTGQ